LAEPPLHRSLQQLVGTIVDERYQIDGLIGAGSMGAVFRGQHLALGKPVAVKFLHPELAKHPEIAARFAREGRSMSRLDHPNCIGALDFGETDAGLPYLVMPLLEGHALDEWMGQVHSPRSALDIMTQVFAGLEHAHTQGVVHRDLKPENVFVTEDPDGGPLFKIVDFGVARIVRDATAKDNITATPTILGTPDYMSPEQALGATPDARTDLYAAGIMFYELLAGKLPFHAEAPELLMQAHLMKDPPPLPPEVPETLAQVVYRSLQKERDNRYSSVTEVLGVLDRVRPQLG
jgi:serine/threonine protein kinase